VAALLAGCKTAPETAAAEPHFVVADVILSVNNQSGREMEVYLLAGSVEHSLGGIAARSSRSFSLPGGLGDSRAETRFEARRRRASTGIRSDLFSLAHGQQVRWTFDEKGSRGVTKN
jgi:hypothetical protein